jgi:hypothetical protein
MLDKLRAKPGGKRPERVLLDEVQANIPGPGALLVEDLTVRNLQAIRMHYRLEPIDDGQSAARFQLARCGRRHCDPASCGPKQPGEIAMAKNECSYALAVAAFAAASTVYTTTAVLPPFVAVAWIEVKLTPLA